MKEYKLTDVCDFQGGTQPPKNEWINEPRNGYIRMLQIRDFTQGKSQHIEYVKDNKKVNKCKEDDILIARYGASIGKIVSGLAGAYNVALIKTIPNENLLTKKYLQSILKSPIFQKFILSIGARAAQAGFNKDDLSRFKLSLPSLQDQFRIAEILTQSENLITQRKESIFLLDELLKSTFLEMFGDPVRNEKGWNTKKLDKLSKLERGRFSPRPRNDPSYFDGIYPFIQTGDISKSENRLVNFNQTLNEKGIKVSKEFKKGAIVIAIVGATIGATAILKIDVYATDSIIGISVNKELIDETFLEFSLRFWKPVLLKNAPEAARANINLDILNKLKITLPPLNLQTQFSTIVEKVEVLKSDYQASLNELENIYGVLSQKAFKGELNIK